MFLFLYFQEFIYMCTRCVAAQSTVTTKIEIFPLIDGIITLDSLRIDVKEKGKDYLRLLYLTNSYARN